MDDLIESLQIFRKYMTEDVYAPTHCEHDKLHLYCASKKMQAADAKRVAQLGWYYQGRDRHWCSYRFGSC